MASVFDQLADAFTRRKLALAEKDKPKTKLAGSDYFMPKSSKEDLAQQQRILDVEGLPGVLKEGASQMYHNPIVNTAIGLTPGAGDVQSGYEAVQSAKEGNWGEAGLNALGVLPFVPALGGIIAGRGAKTADLAKLATAEDMAKAGASREEIWNQTGWFQGPDKQWKFEIPDYAAFTKGSGTLQEVAGKRGAEMGKVLHHPELMKAYPEIKDIPLQFRQGKGAEYGSDIFGNTHIRFGSEVEGKSVPLHELQHHIQGQEAFARGGNPAWMSNELSDMYMEMKNLENTSRFQEGKKRLNDMISGLTDKSMSKDEAMKEWEHIQNNYPELKAHDQLFGEIKKLNPEATRQDLLRDWYPEKAYYRLAGEEEARMVQKRMEMTPEELRANPPWTMYETPESGQIVRFDRIPDTQASIENVATDYRMAHTAPNREFGAQLHDLSAIYPEDIYSANAARYYGDGGDAAWRRMDNESVRIAQSFRGKPDADVTIYRAVPKDEKITAINPGDWVTINKDYARTHGESNLPEGYKIISQKVKAKDIWTNADSVHEYGYDPQL